MDSKFDIQESAVDDLTEIILKNGSNNDFITIIPELGARLNKAMLSKGREQISVLKSISSINMESRDDMFNNAKLFPYANRVKGGEYRFNDINYKLELNYPEENNACHGFLYNRKFELLEYSIEGSFVKAIYYHDYKGDAEGYPFPFRIYIAYVLNSRSEVTVTTRVINTSGQKMLFTDGWHPYFTLGESIDGLMLSIESGAAAEKDMYGIPVNQIKIEPYLRKELKELFLDTTFFLDEKDKVYTELYSPAKDIGLIIWQEAAERKYSYLSVYTPPGRKSIAIEPMTSNVDAFNNMQDVIVLEPGKVWEAKYGFYLR